MATKNNPFMPAPGGAPKTLPGKNTAPAGDEYTVDLTDVQQNSYTIPDGVYKVKCVDVEQGVSKGGNPQFIWTFEVVDGPHKGFSPKVFTALTPAAMWKVAETVQALGVGQTGQVVKFKRSDVIGKVCGALIEQSEYNGNMRSSVTRVMSVAEMEQSN